MRQNDAPKPFHWTSQKEAAAVLLAEDHLTDEQIAVAVGCSRPTLVRWKAEPDFAARIQEVARRLGDLALRHAIARRHKRVGRLQDRWDRMGKVIEERAAAPEMQDVPGGTTGLLVKTIKQIGSGDNAREVEEYEVDVGLLKEEREYARQAAQEIGQWVEKNEHTGKDGKDLIPPRPALTDEQFDRLTPEERMLYLRGRLPATEDGHAGDV